MNQLKSEQTIKIDDLDVKYTKLIEKYKIQKTENKDLKSRLDKSESDNWEKENFKEQCVELKERNRLLTQKVELFELESQTKVLSPQTLKRDPLAEVPAFRSVRNSVAN